MKIISFLFVLTIFTSCAGVQPSGNFFGAQHSAQAASDAAQAAAMHNMHHTPPPPPPPMSGF